MKSRLSRFCTASGSLDVTSERPGKAPLLMLGRGTLDARTYLSTALSNASNARNHDGARAGLTYGYGLGKMNLRRQESRFSTAMTVASTVRSRVRVRTWQGRRLV